MCGTGQGQLSAAFLFLSGQLNLISLLIEPLPVLELQYHTCPAGGAVQVTMSLFTVVKMHLTHKLLVFHLHNEETVSFHTYNCKYEDSLQISIKHLQTN